jgi:hypothetical protein
MQNTQIRCTNCDFEGALVHRAIKLIYELPEGELISTSYVRGWCHHCDRISNIEPEIDGVHARQQIDVLTEKTRSLLYALRTFLGRFFRVRDDEREELATLALVLKLASIRKSAPRCLACGQEGAERLEIGMAGSFVHKCGGKLFSIPTAASAARFSFSKEEIYLDVEGRVKRYG